MDSLKELPKKIYEIECILIKLGIDFLEEAQEDFPDTLSEKRLEKAEKILLEWCFDKIVDLCETPEDIKAELDKAYERLDEVD